MTAYGETKRTSGGEIAGKLRDLTRFAPSVIHRELTAGVEQYRVPRTQGTRTVEFRVFPNGEFDWSDGSEPKLFDSLLGHFGQHCKVRATYNLTVTSLAQESFSMTLSTPEGVISMKAKRPLQVLLNYLHDSFVAGSVPPIAEHPAAPPRPVVTAPPTQHEDEDDDDLLIID